MKKFIAFHRKNASISAALVAVLILSAAFACRIGVSAQNSGTEPLPELPFANDSARAEGSLYPSSDVKVISAAEFKNQKPEAEAAEGNVASIDGASISESGIPGVGVTFDYSPYQISGYGINSVSIRAFIPAGVKEMNITVNGGEICLARYSLSGFQKNKWTEFSFYGDGLYFLSGHNIIEMTNEYGQFATFSVNFVWPAVDIAADGEGQTESGEALTPVYETVYIDSINIKMTEGAAGKPSLEYDGPELIDQTAEKPLQIGELRAFDEFEDRELPVTMRWEGNSGVDENGLTKEGGPYTLILEASNSFRQTVSKKVTVNVRPRDNVAPEIIVNTDSLTVSPGTYGTMNVFATDNEDDVSVDVIWSDGALDKKGRLLSGQHELTLYSEDLTGNSSTRIIKVLVPEAENGSVELPDNTRDESKLRFGMPVWAILLIAAVSACAVIALIIIIVKLVNKKRHKDDKAPEPDEAEKGTVPEVNGEKVEEDTRMTAEYIEGLEKMQSEAESGIEAEKELENELEAKSDSGDEA